MPAWVPVYEITRHIELVREFDRSLKTCSPDVTQTMGGLESAGINLDDTRRELCGMYSLDSNTITSPINTDKYEFAATSKSLRQLVLELRTATLKACCENLIECWLTWRAVGYSSEWLYKLTGALALLNVMLYEWPYNMGRPPPEVEQVLHSLELSRIRYCRISQAGASLILLMDL
jgi:hypothetical protein